MSNNKVLFIVEGESDEVKFLKQLYAKCFPQEEFEVYSYKTNIHILAQLLYNEYPDFDEDEVDIRLVLRSVEDDEYKRKILSQMYRDIYRIKTISVIKTRICVAKFHKAPLSRELSQYECESLELDRWIN